MIHIDPLIAHIVPANTNNNDPNIEKLNNQVSSYLESLGFSPVPSMGDNFYCETLCSSDGVDGYISGNDWGNVKEVLNEQVSRLGMKVEFVEFLGLAWFRIVR